MKNTTKTATSKKSASTVAASKTTKFAPVAASTLAQIKANDNKRIAEVAKVDPKLGKQLAELASGKRKMVVLGDPKTVLGKKTMANLQQGVAAAQKQIAAETKKAADKAVAAGKNAKQVLHDVKAAQQKAVAKPAAADRKTTKAFEDTQSIAVLVKANPFKSTLGQRFQLLLDKKVRTVADWVKATKRYSDLRWFVAKKAIAIK